MNRTSLASHEELEPGRIWQVQGGNTEVDLKQSDNRVKYKLMQQPQKKKELTGIIERVNAKLTQSL